MKRSKSRSVPDFTQACITNSFCHGLLGSKELSLETFTKQIQDASILGIQIEDQHTIEMFVLWLYGFDLETEDPVSRGSKFSKQLVFADKIHVIGLQNKAIEVLFTK